MVRRKQYSFDMVFVITLFCVFIAISLLLANTAAAVYQKVTTNADCSYSLRTSLSYVAGKLRSNGVRTVSIKNENGTDVLLITEKINDESFDTAIYFVDGMLYEQLIQHESRIDTAAGSCILRLEDFRMEMNRGLLTLHAKSAGNERELCIYTDSE